MAAGDDDAKALSALRWNWEDGYVIDGAGTRWTAKRRDGERTLEEDSAAGLLGAIRADYMLSPVGREDGR